MASPNHYRDGARSKAAAPRASGGGLLALEDASAFGSPTPASPAKVSIYRDGSLLTVLLATGRAGDDLAIAGPADGKADRAIQAGDDAWIAWTAGDADLVHARIDQALEDLAGIELTPGPQGEPGTPGTVIRSGSGTPSDSLGVDGDYYVDVTNGDLYQKVAATYGAVGNLKGPPGEEGGATPIMVSGLVKGDGVGGVSAAVPGVDYATPAALAAGLSSKADASTTVNLTGAQTLYDKSARASGTGDALTILNNGGLQASGFDKDGNGFPWAIDGTISQNVDVTTGAGLTKARKAPLPGRIQWITVQALVNTASTTATFKLTKNGTVVYSQDVTPGSTTLVTIPASSLAAGVADVAAGDVFDWDCTTAAVGLQSIQTRIFYLARNR